MDRSNDWAGQVAALQRQAQRSTGKRGIPKAIKLYNEALSLIPEPVEDSVYGMILYASLGDLYLLEEKMEEALDCFTRAKLCRGGDSSPSINFQMGKIYYELGDMERAKSALLDVYIATEGRAFEQQPIKYYDLIRDEPGIGPPSPSPMGRELVKRLIARAERQEGGHQNGEAIDLYRQALFLIPEPIEEYAQSTRILAAIGELYFLEGETKRAFEYYSQAVRCKDGLGSVTIHKRLGQLRYERGEMDRAKDELMRAYMGGGEEAFEGEDPRYYELIRDIVEAERP